VKLEEQLKNAFGLNLYETRVYLAALKGRSGPKEIASTSGVPMSRVYDTLKSLEKKGFVEQHDDSYSAVPPETALTGRLAQFRAEFEREAKERERAKGELLEELKSLHMEEKAVPEVLVLKGIYSIAGKFLEVLIGSEDVLITVRRGIEAVPVFKEYLDGMGGKVCRIRALVPEELEISGEDLELASRFGIEIRRCPSTLFDLMVADGRDVMLGVPDPASSEAYHAIALFMRNPQFAKAIAESLETLWRQSP